MSHIDTRRQVTEGKSPAAGRPTDGGMTFTVLKFKTAFENRSCRPPSAFKGFDVRDDALSVSLRAFAG
jgi:hypothetical protein